MLAKLGGMDFGRHGFMDFIPQYFTIFGERKKYLFGCMRRFMQLLQSVWDFVSFLIDK